MVIDLYHVDAEDENGEFLSKCVKCKDVDALHWLYYEAEDGTYVGFEQAFTAGMQQWRFKKEGGKVVYNEYTTQSNPV